MSRRITRSALVPLAGLASLALMVAGCSSSSSSESTSSAASAASESTAASSPAAPTSSAAASTPAPADVSIALSWSPNTDYTGVYVAQSLGYYADEGINLTILPYASTAPETLVSNGTADFGFSYQAGVAYARSAGADIVAVFAPDQKGTYAIGVRGDRDDIKSPKDLDGKIYAGFGTPDEGPLLKYVIQQDGGKGEFESVALDSAAYEAVYAGKADFTIPVVTWEGVAAELAGKPLKTFSLTDYGFPDQYSVLIATSNAYLQANPDVAKRFIAATAKGYAYAADNPAEAAKIVVDANPGVFTDPQLVTKSQELLASGGYLKDADGNVGTQDPAKWKAYGEFLYSNGLLADSDGKPLATEPDWASYYTNEYLPTSSS